MWTGNELIVAQGTGRDEVHGQVRHGLRRDHPRLRPSGRLHLALQHDDWTLASDQWLRLKNTNIGWPFLALAEDGTVGATFVGAPDGGNPRPIAAFLNEHKYVYALAAGQPQRRDYYSLRPGRTSVVRDPVAPTRSTLTRSTARTALHRDGTGPRRRPPRRRRITSRDVGRSFNAGAPIAFNATVSDYEDGVGPKSAIAWQVDGVEIGRGRAWSTTTACWAPTCDRDGTEGPGSPRRRP